MHPSLLVGRGFDAHCRMQHHHENDTHSFSEIDPVDPGLRGIAMLYRSWDRMGADQRDAILSTAEVHLENIERL